ncbi:hypothetical protein RN001_013660 [Aquatica leii]|uniref:Odorant receptor n=1 Tax=Aquatica leii TaxID=1421715 RepID=A0AAN7NWK1_9COLE|nr:hypothetical protein RN001_013660 [Aquatica leii]
MEQTNCAILSTHTFINRKKIRELLLYFEKEEFSPSTERGGKEAESKVLEEWISTAKTQCLLFICSAGSSLIGQVIYTLITRLTNDDYHNWKLGFAETAITINVTYSPNFEIIWAYQNLAYLYLIINACVTVLLMTGTLKFISIQFIFLQMYLRRISKLSQCKEHENIVNNKNNTKEKYLKEYVQDAIIYHISITKLAKKAMDLFSGSILTTFTFSLGLLCTSAYRASLHPFLDLHVAFILIEALAGSFPSIMICFYGETMRKESEDVALAAYDIDFVGANIDIQKSIILLIRRSQTATKLRAGKFLDASLATLVWIMRTSISAYMMLRTVNAKNGN